MLGNQGWAHTTSARGIEKINEMTRCIYLTKYFLFSSTRTEKKVDTKSILGACPTIEIMKFGKHCSVSYANILKYISWSKIDLGLFAWFKWPLDVELVGMEGWPEILLEFEQLFTSGEACCEYLSNLWLLHGFDT